MSCLFTSDDHNTGASAWASVLPVNIQGWSPSRLVWSPCCPRDFQESSPASQFKGIKSLVFCLLYGSVSQLYVTNGKTISLTIWTFVGKVVPLLFNTLSRFVITFMPRNNCLLISWLQSPYTKGIEESTKVSVVFQKVWMSWNYLFISIYEVSTIF